LVYLFELSKDGMKIIVMPGSGERGGRTVVLSIKKI
jgi:hypothetical protein